MARYRKIDPKIWGDERFNRLSSPPPCGKFLWLYLLTCPEATNVPGIFRAGELGLSEALGWDLKGFREAFREAFLEGLVKADWKARVVWIPNAIRYHRPESPNVIRSWSRSWDEIPECSLKDQAYCELKAFLEGLSEGFQEAFAKALPKPLPNQKQKQEQEQEQDIQPAQEPFDLIVQDAQSDLSVKVQTVWGAYCEHHPRCRRTLAAGKRYGIIASRLEDGYSVAELIDAINGYHLSPFHCGENDAGTRYLALELILRDGSHVDRGIEMAAEPPKPRPKNATERELANRAAKFS